MTVRTEGLTESLQAEIDELTTEIKDVQIDLNFHENLCRVLQDRSSQLRSLHIQLVTAVEELKKTIPEVA
jgi:predicted DNA-binding ArsR family transcriptional regulator